jgi:hypothetical protein
MLGYFTSYLNPLFLWKCSQKANRCCQNYAVSQNSLKSRIYFIKFLIYFLAILFYTSKYMLSSHMWNFGNFNLFDKFIISFFYSLVFIFQNYKLIFSFLNVSFRIIDAKMVRINTRFDFSNLWKLLLHCISNIKFSIEFRQKWKNKFKYNWLLKFIALRFCNILFQFFKALYIKAIMSSFI